MSEETFLYVSAVVMFLGSILAIRARWQLEEEIKLEAQKKEEEKMTIEELEEENKKLKKQLNQWKNPYDANNNIERVKVLNAGSLKLAAYRVRNLDTGEFNKELQIHMTFNNTVVAVLGMSSAKLLSKFIEDIET